MRSEWDEVLHYRPAADRPAVAGWLASLGITPTALDAVLREPETFLGLADSADPHWHSAYGGPEAAVAIATELDKLLAAQQRYTAHVRATTLALLVAEHGTTAASRRVAMPHQQVGRLVRRAAAGQCAAPIPPLATQPAAPRAHPDALPRTARRHHTA